MFFQLLGASTCRRCGPWEGVIVSNIPEEAEAYQVDYAPDVESRGLFHSSCRHNWAETGPPGTPVDGKYTKAEKDALRNYQISSYDMNAKLRGPKNAIDDALAGDIEALDTAISKSARFTEDTTLFRGVDATEYRVLERAALQGKAYKVKSFVSTTSDRNIAVDFGMDYKLNRARIVEVRVPKGTAGLSVDQYGMMNSGASEILLQRGLTFSVRFAENKVDIILEAFP